MTTLHNEITIDAPIENIWRALSVIDELENYDPIVKRSVALSEERAGLDAFRKVDMEDGKNWFEEKIIVYETNKALTFELTACSFPIHHLKHSYSFEIVGNRTRVKQVMAYSMKHGFFGQFLDWLMVRRQSDNGIKKFFVGLKSYVEKANRVSN